MAYMLDSDWLKKFLLRSDWLPTDVALFTTDISSHLSIAVYCAENWKLLLAPTFLQFPCVRSKKISTKGGQARTQVGFQFSHFSYH